MKWESFGCFVGTGCTFLPSRHQELQRRLRKHRRPGVWWAHWQRYWYQLLERTLWLHFSVEWNRSWRKLDITTCIMPFSPLDCQLPRAWWPQSILHWFLDGRFIGTAGWTIPNSYATDASKGRRTLRKAKNVWSSSQTSLPSVFPNFPALLEDPVCDAWFVSLYCLPWHRRCPVCPWSKWMDFRGHFVNLCYTSKNLNIICNVISKCPSVI